ncbi:SGNH/GDSL hydrolase family protein [Azospirillum halopraeferens]|uniref:SGNH/GDSL hydrolase family protein n=1 Tax=Azospirillum halopraeferens TaxID=34010 RepID=UPI000418BE85|nr:SGNH/GDSL hydrolase family protein [Azospirillum halopraeferens]
MRLLPLLAAGLLAVTASAGGAAAAPKAFDRLVVFGDSLSDTGNAGRFTNGPVWAERLAADLGLELHPARDGGANFAVGGARLDPQAGPFGLRAQADMYLARPAPRAAGRTLHVVYGGGNDVLAALGAPAAERRVDEAAAVLAGIVADLARRGATDVLVPNLPDVGITPQVRARGPGAVAEARTLSRRFNAAVDRALQDAAPAGLRLHRLDVWTMAERVTADPAAFGFTDVTTPCGGAGGCNGHLFWDHVHPTATAHARLGEAALAGLRTRIGGG